MTSCSSDRSREGMKPFQELPPHDETNRTGTSTVDPKASASIRSIEGRSLTHAIDPPRCLLLPTPLSLLAHETERGLDALILLSDDGGRARGMRAGQLFSEAPAAIASAEGA